jgi:hypothetical protein
MTLKSLWLFASFARTFTRSMGELNSTRHLDRQFLGSCGTLVGATCSRNCQSRQGRKQDFYLSQSTVTRSLCSCTNKVFG